MDEFSKEEMAQLYSLFRHQSLEILDEMNQDLLALESRGLDEEIILRLRRAAHTIKGDAVCVDLEGVTEIAHRIEDLIDTVVLGKAEFKSAQIDLILEALDAIRTAVSNDEVTDVSANEVARICEVLANGHHHHMAIEFVDEESLAKNANAVEFHEDAVDAKSASGKRKRDYVRVEAATIDVLLNLAGEMVVTRSMMNQIGLEVEIALPRNEVSTRLGGANQQIGRLIAELQRSVLKMRMVSIDQVFNRLARPMRELAGEYGKQVEFVTTGGETELDRTLVDMIYEPLLHLLRNAVDHGLELPSEREAAGKPAQGTIKLAAYHEGNQVVVEVSDDGRGINVDALKIKAIENGSISGSEVASMSDEEAFNLIYLSGLSTAKEITWVSGRGVGAATVKTAIEQLRGSVSIHSEKGKGTTFTLRMPLTLAIIKGLLFTASGRLFALPLLSIDEIARIRPSEITYIDGFESYRLRDRFISLIRPGAALGYEKRKGGPGATIRYENDILFVIFVTIGDRCYGVVAETLLGEQELVIKPLDNQWLQSESLAGASVLGDGRVALILDAGSLVRKAIKYERGRGVGIGVYAG
jgi:two-component system chemotaxis sensor kinase CheA